MSNLESWAFVALTASVLPLVLALTVFSGFWMYAANVASVGWVFWWAGFMA